VVNRGKQLGRRDFLRQLAFGTVAFAGLGGILRLGMLRDDSRYVQTVTTPTGAAINAAMDKFGGKPGVVALKPGAVYTQTTPADQLVMPSNMTMFMNGATLRLNTTSGVGFAQITNADTKNGNSNISIIGPGVIDGNQSVSGHDDAKTWWGGMGNTIGIQFFSCSNLTLENLEVKNCYRYGINLMGNQAPQARYVNLSNLIIHNTGSTGLWVANGQRAVNWSNIIVHDCGYDPDNNNASVLIDASEQIVTGLQAYGNQGIGIFIRNVFMCNLSGLTATRNGMHGIGAVALTNSVGSDWLAVDNGDGGSGYSDVYFEGTGNPPWYYGTTHAVTITGIRCGSNDGPSAWKGPHSGTPANEAYALYIEDAIDSFGGDVRLLNVQATAGLSDTIRFPATMGNLIVSTGR
jgi:hypothetical protein